MKHSPIFYSSQRHQIEDRIKARINAEIDLLSARNISIPRATGDALQDLLAENFKAILGDLCKDYSSSFARRAMADLAFTDTDNFYYVRTYADDPDPSGGAGRTEVS